jgi:hypothetical protein
VRTKPAIKHRLHQLIEAASVSEFLREGDLSRLPALQTAVALELPQMEDILAPDSAPTRSTTGCSTPDGGAQPVTIGGESATPISSINRRPEVAFLITIPLVCARFMPN